MGAAWNLITGLITNLEASGGECAEFTSAHAQLLNQSPELINC